jgi:hypothetical protein
MDDEVERLRAKKQSYVETEREAALEFGEECGTDDVEYCALLRIASAVDEVRREIDAQGLQDLIDPEHKMDAGDWVRLDLPRFRGEMRAWDQALWLTSCCPPVS